MDDLGGGDGGQFGVGFVGDVADAVAGGEGGGGGSEDDAGGFFARDEGEGGFVEARAEVAMGDGVSLVGLGKGEGDGRVNVVDADEFVADEDLAVLELGDGKVGFPVELVDAAGFLDEDARHGLGDGRHGVVEVWCGGALEYCERQTHSALVDEM